MVSLAQRRRAWRHPFHDGRGLAIPAPLSADRVAPVADRDKASAPRVRMAIPAMRRASPPTMPIPVPTTRTPTSRVARDRAARMQVRVPADARAASPAAVLVPVARDRAARVAADVRAVDARAAVDR